MLSIDLKEVTMVCLLLLLFLACSTVPPEDLVGTWVADAYGLALLKEVPGGEGREPFIELRTNGSFVAADIPDRLVGGDLNKSIALIDGSGTWVAAEESGRQIVRLRFLVVNGADVDWRPKLFVSTVPRPTLWFDLSDPDEGQHFGFVKREQ